jgi:hypothetical protein
MDIAGMLRPKTVEVATVNLVAYLINNQPTPGNPMALAHRGALDSLAILGDKLTPGRRKLHTMLAALSIDHHRRTLVMISRRIKSTKLNADALRALASTATIRKKPKSMMESFVVPIA